MESVLHSLRLRDCDKEETRQSIWCWTNLELLRVVIHDNPSECLLPPPSKRDWVPRVNDQLLPLDAHASQIRALTCQRPSRPTDDERHPNTEQKKTEPEITRADDAPMPLDRTHTCPLRTALDQPGAPTPEIDQNTYAGPGEEKSPEYRDDRGHTRIVGPALPA